MTSWHGGLCKGKGTTMTGLNIEISYFVTMTS